MSVFTRLLRERYPDYDPERYYYRDLDYLRLPNGAEVIVLSGRVKECELIVTRSGFGMRKGGVLRVDTDSLPIVMRADYVPLLPRVKGRRHLRWEVGDVVIDEYGNTMVLIESRGTQDFSDGPRNSFIGVMLVPHDGSGYSRGCRFVIYDPHTEYHT